MKPQQSTTTVPLTLAQINELLDAVHRAPPKQNCDLADAVAELESSQTYLEMFNGPERRPATGKEPNLRRFGFVLLADQRHAKEVTAITKGSMLHPHFAYYTRNEHVLLDVYPNHPDELRNAPPALRLRFDTTTGAMQAATSDLFCAAVIRLLVSHLPEDQAEQLATIYQRQVGHNGIAEKRSYDQTALHMMGAQIVPLTQRPEPA